MKDTRSTSFTEVALVEAVARMASVYLALRPVPPSRHRRLTSRLLAFDVYGDLVLAVPAAGEEKVFIPEGWDVGLFFSVGEFMLQALTQVAGHSFHRVDANRRVDALIVRRPERLVSINQRSEVRQEVSQYVPVTLWPTEPSGEGSVCSGPPLLGPPCSGLLTNRSHNGLGTLLQSELPFRPGTNVLVRLEDPAATTAELFRAILKHCTPQIGGGYLAGLGDLTELGPGQAVELVRTLTGETD